MNSTYTNFDNYGLRYLPAHLHQSKKLETLAMLLLDINWLEVKLSNLGISELIKDYTLIENDQNIKLIHKALIKSISILDKDPSQWRSQLSGRLANYPEIQSWLETTPSKSPWIKSINETLDGVDGMLIGTIVGNKAVCLAISPNDLFFATGSVNGEVKIWDINSLKSISEIKGNEQNVTSLAFTSDGGCIIYASQDSTIRIWDWQNRQEIHKLQGHTGPVTNLYLTKDNKFLLSGSKDGSLRLWNIKDGNQILVMDGYKGGKIWVSPDMLQVIAGTKIWDIAQKSEPQDIISDSTEVTATAISVDGKYLIFGQESQIVMVDRKSGEHVRTFSFREFDGSGTYIAWVFDYRNYKAHVVAVSPNGNFIIAGLSGPMRSWYKNLILWNTRSENQITFLDGHNGYVNAVAFTNDGHLAISVSRDDEMIKIWDVEKPIPMVDLTTYKEEVPINAIAVAPNGEFIVSGGIDRQLRLWKSTDGIPSVETSTLVNGWRKEEIITALDFTADGTLIVGTMDDDVNFRRVDNEPGYIYLVKLEPDGTNKRANILASTYCKRNPLKLIVSRDGNRIIYSNAEGIHYINLSEEKTKSDQDTIIPDIQVAKESKTTIFGFDFSKFFPFFLPRQKPSPQQQNIPNNEKPKENPLHNHIKMSHYETGGIAISEDGKYAYWAFYDKLYEWNLETSTVSREIEFGKPGHLVEKFRYSKNRISVSRDLAIALLGFGDGTIYAIDLLSGNVIWNKQAHDNSVNALAMISDRQLVVSMSNDQTIKIWNLLNGELLTVFTSDTKIKDLVVDPDNCVIIVSADDPPRVLNLLFKDEEFL